ncbi:MAG: cohesin domain-containing protein [Pyrinomonadaceae bacterium]
MDDQPDANKFEVMPLAQTVAAGSINNFSWTYDATNAGNNLHTATITIPAAWTDPQASVPTGPGYVSVDPGTCGATIFSIVGDVITVNQNPRCTQPTFFTLHYNNATAPTPASFPTTYVFVSTPVNASPTVTVGPPTVVPSIAGNISYAVVSKPVPGVLINGTGAPSVSTVTGSDGSYLLTGFGAGAYTMSRSKAAQTCGMANGIYASDASLISRHVVGLQTLSGDALEAAKVGGFPTVTSFDAGMIARFVVGICDESNLSGKWLFNPASNSYPNVTTTMTGVNYTAYMLGDVNGDWDPTSAGRSSTAENDSKTVQVSLPSSTVSIGSTVDMPLRIDGLNGTDVGSYQFDIEYDPAVLEPASIAADLSGTLAAGLSVVYNVVHPGLLKVAVYGALPVGGDGVYADLHFNAIGKTGSVSAIKIGSFILDDGTTIVSATNGSVAVRTANSSAKNE